MDAQDFRSLQEAYLDVYQELDEAREDKVLTPLQKIRKRNQAYSIPGEPAGQQTSNRRAERSSTRGVKKERGAKSAFGTMRHVGGPYNEQADLYDIILSHLLDEGYADTPEQAEVIMVNMSEDWRESIVEEVIDEANRAERELGLSSRERERARNLNQHTDKPIFYKSTKRGRGDNSDPILNRAHKGMTAKRQASHKAGRYLRGDTGGSDNVVRSRYQANKDHENGYPSIRRVDT